jgi:hypothetical protein
MTVSIIFRPFEQNTQSVSYSVSLAAKAFVRESEAKKPALIAPVSIVRPSVDYFSARQCRFTAYP